MKGGKWKRGFVRTPYFVHAFPYIRYVYVTCEQVHKTVWFLVWRKECEMKTIYYLVYQYMFQYDIPKKHIEKVQQLKSWYKKEQRMYIYLFSYLKILQLRKLI